MTASSLWARFLDDEELVPLKLAILTAVIFAGMVRW